MVKLRRAEASTHPLTCPLPGSALFDSCFELAESVKRNLGWLTPQAWADAAGEGRLIAAVSADGALLGYVLYRLRRNDVVVVQLVVSPSARNRGVARQLVEMVSGLFPERRGIAVRCRNDYPAHHMWPRLDFYPLGDRPGRSLAGLPLTDWWRDHGHVNLMSWQGAPDSVTSVAVDANVLLDLSGEDTSPGARITNHVFRDVLDSRIEVLVTPEMAVEFGRQPDQARRQRLLAMLTNYPALAVHADSMSRARLELASSAGFHPISPRDRSDLNHLAYAHAAGVSVFVTRDGPATKRWGEAARAVGMTMVSPQTLVTLIDELESAPTYWPSALLDTGYMVREAAADDPAVGVFLASGGGERRKAYDERLKLLASTRPRSHRRVLTDPAGQPIALLGTLPGDGVLFVTMLRMRPSAVQTSLAAQIASLLRPMAVEAGVEVVKVSDPHPHPLLVEGLLRDGFRRIGENFIALTVNAVCTRADVGARIARAASVLSPEERAGLVESFKLPDSNDSVVTAALERHVRPLRLTDAPMDTWLVPIKAPYASALFGYPRQLFERDNELGISVEHVYYHGGSATPVVPARVLWYLSGRHHGEVIGCSELAEATSGTPKDLFRRFRRLGVYQYSDVATVAGKRGIAKALRVLNTELFERPLGLDAFRELAAANGQTLQLRSTSRLRNELYVAIMREVRGAS
ncbi:MAG TPA: GNAT family N-acetyltransferase [Jatrophihabitans sp.]|uniref:GNAT family N-acetyltransferase n=1 Tax=Jatrophihabitans sp. TaxID=1932789 RepID=UPI002EE21FAD